MARTAIQLHTLRGVGEPLPDTITHVGESSFDGVELYDDQFDALEDEDLVARSRDALVDADLEVVSAHVKIDRLESSFEKIVEVCHAVGCPTLVVPTYEPAAFTTREGIEATADRLAALAGDLESHDISLLYHNHTFEFGEVDGGHAVEVFVDASEGRFEFEPDTGLATAAGYDALDLLELLDGHAPVVHLTDTVPGDDSRLHTDVGEGVLDVEACAAVAGEIDAEWLVCENGRTTDGLASLEHGSEAFPTLRECADGG